MATEQEVWKITRTLRIKWVVAELVAFIFLGMVAGTAIHIAQGTWSVAIVVVNLIGLVGVIISVVLYFKNYKLYSARMNEYDKMRRQALQDKYEKERRQLFSDYLDQQDQGEQSHT